jgi:hypothetical protein
LMHALPLCCAHTKRHPILLEPVPEFRLPLHQLHSTVLGSPLLILVRSDRTIRTNACLLAVYHDRNLQQAAASATHKRCQIAFVTAFKGTE